MKDLKKLLIFVFMFFTAFAMEALTSTQIMQKTTNAINNASCISATFKIVSSFGSSSGTFKSKGKKFNYISNQASVWYDGKNMWTTNPKAKETTIMVPTTEEIRESNPLDYIKSNASLYNSSLLNQTDKTKYVVNLQPKNGNKRLPNLVLTLNSKTFKPIKIKILEKGSKPIEITLTNVNYSANANDSEFKYPKSKFSGFDLVDLR